jgi:hypothetical protein
LANHCNIDGIAANRYVAGLIDGMTLGTEMGARKLFCPPADITAVQATAIACKFAQDNPKDWNVSAPYMIAQSLAEAWPCPKS